MASYSFRGFESDSGSANPHTYTTIDIGTASADRLVIVGITLNSATTTITSVVVNGITLNRDVDFLGSLARNAIFSGLVTSGNGVQNIVMTKSTGFDFTDILVWTAVGTTGVVHHTGTGTTGHTPINVTAGEFLFAAGHGTGSGADYNSSTETPFENKNSGNGNFLYGADWTIITTNAAFDVFGNAGGGSDIAAAAYTPSAAANVGLGIQGLASCEY